VRPRTDERWRNLAIKVALLVSTSLFAEGAAGINVRVQARPVLALQLLPFVPPKHRLLDRSTS
jgi:hypothetical protein